MRELYREFFCIPKHGKVREKVMLTRIVMTVMIVIMCLAAMSLAAYAYFSYNITSGSNIIKAAKFETQVQVQITDADGKAVDNSQITPITSDHKNFRIEDLEVGKWYTVTIAHTEQSTAKTGFVVVTADNCPNTYHTQQLAKDVNAEGGQTPSVTFQLMVTDTTNVHLLAHWGTSSQYDGYKNNGDQDELYITQGEEITMIIGGKDISKDDDGTGDEGTSGTTQTDTSTPPTTENTTLVGNTQSSEQATIPETSGMSGTVSTTESSTTTTEITTSQPAETTLAETSGTKATKTTDATANTETQPTEETTGTTTTEANE